MVWNTGHVMGMRTAAKIKLFYNFTKIHRYQAIVMQ